MQIMQLMFTMIMLMKKMITMKIVMTMMIMLFRQKGGLLGRGRERWNLDP